MIEIFLHWILVLCKSIYQKLNYWTIEPTHHVGSIVQQGVNTFGYCKIIILWSTDIVLVPGGGGKKLSPQYIGRHNHPMPSSPMEMCEIHWR